jgi:hypothetical protein
VRLKIKIVRDTIKVTAMESLSRIGMRRFRKFFSEIVQRSEPAAKTGDTLSCPPEESFPWTAVGMEDMASLFENPYLLNSSVFLEESLNEIGIPIAFKSNGPRITII